MAPAKIAAYGLKHSGETEVDEATDIHGNEETSNDDPPPIENFTIFSLHICHSKPIANCGCAKGSPPESVTPPPDLS